MEELNELWENSHLKELPDDWTATGLVVQDKVEVAKTKQRSCEDLYGRWERRMCTSETEKQRWKNMG